MAGETYTWTGASGTAYFFYVYPRHPIINSNQMGNYIYAKRNQNNQWVPVYIGQGDLSVRCTTNHHQIRCLDSKGSTHIHLRLTAGGEAARKAVENDLLVQYTNAYAPHGCNQREGG
jgi:hypothetical protein